MVLIRAGFYFSEYFLELYGLQEETELEVRYVDPITFLRPERFDLACKLYYIECREKRVGLDFAKKMYQEHIKSFSDGTYREPGNDDKDSLEKYFETFDFLIDEIKNNGFDKNKSVIPIGLNGNIINGSHRVAICIYYGIKVPVVQIEKKEFSFDYKFFAGKGMQTSHLDFLAYQYTRYTPNTYLCFLWPRIKPNQFSKVMDDVLESACGVVYKKQIQFNYRGLTQLMIHLYGHQEWTGNIENKYLPITEKSCLCFAEGEQTTVYVLQSKSLDEIVKLKGIIRALFQIGNHSIHISDTHDEAIEAARMVLNDNSIQLLNMCYILSDATYVEKLYRFKQTAELTGLSEDCLLNVRSLEALCGGRFLDHIEYCLFKSNDFRDGSYCVKENQQFIYDWDNYCYCFGMKFVSLSNLPDGLYQSLVSLCEEINPYDSVWKSFLKLQNRPMWKLIIKKMLRFCLKLLRKPYLALHPVKKRTLKNWDDMAEAFASFQDSNYVVMRNWEDFYDDILLEGHNDIDILCASKKDAEDIIGAMGAVPRFAENGHSYKFLYQSNYVDLDIRIVGDGYYDKKWEKEILKSRAFNALGFYMMDKENYLYSLIYHAIYQKETFSDDYLNRLRLMAEKEDLTQVDLEGMLYKYMKEHRYYCTVPLDRSVIKNFNPVLMRNRIKYPLSIRWKHVAEDAVNTVKNRLK